MSEPEKPKLKFWEPYHPQPGEYHHRLPATVFYVFAAVVFALILILGWPTLSGIWAGQISSVLDVLLVIAGIALEVLLLAIAIKGGSWEMVANDTGIVWRTPDKTVTQLFWPQLKAFDIQVRSAESSNRYRLHLQNGTIVEIPGNCVGDEPSLQTALALRIPCLGVFHANGTVESLDNIQRPLLDRLSDRKNQ